MADAAGARAQTVVQLHPTLACNLTCAHCYSSSSPHERGGTDPAALERALPELAAEGYRVVSVSGGEPFLYPHLQRVARAAHAAGMRVNLVTNGTVRVPSWVLDDPASLDVVAVSLDGTASRHDELRRRAGAFDRALGTLRRLRAHGVRTAVVSCVTRASLPDVPDLYEVCAAEGVDLLRLHPLARVGRGTELVDEPGGGLGLDAAQLLRLRVVAEMLSTMGGPVVVADAPLAGELRALARDAAARRAGSDRAALADTVNPLVVREDGAVLPFAYGLPVSCSLGTLESFTAGSEAHRRGRAAAELLERAVAALPEDDGACLDWEAHLVRCASSVGVGGR
ncbi:Radical SAM domain protein [Cellulomonas flavigena DSM 20109]|uniref:Radical SAM domain protein n=1 Tax=Cellulomonas flavigena (strain ATCC 482 / DSM 20109 / BCRC 11376 / JCM 18109 / NBRC 3775 / NCIMB 8073 / NRS 134) TaxID=446466 RepID=D5UF44_CELFN|nr:radical SAM protein [Cellulomonas flavigena]ADG72931.1 Radical SAM domain protein [Cellulomonas flavigena DSM 20109]